MEILSERVGYIFKQDLVDLRQFFYIDDSGILHYSLSPDSIEDIIGLTSSKIRSKDNEDIIDIGACDTFYFNNDTNIEIMKSYKSKEINLRGCQLGKISLQKPEEPAFKDMKSLLCFELIVKDSSYLVFALNDGGINQIFSFIRPFAMISSSKLASVPLAQNCQTVVRSNTIGLDHDGKKTLDEVVSAKLGGKYVNQRLWEQRQIRLKKISSDEERLEEWVELENDSHYSGMVKRNMPHGRGKEYRSDGIIYEGTFYEGKWCGFGTLTNGNLDVVEGEFIDGCICGI